MPSMRYVNDGRFDGLTVGRTYEIIREEHEDGFDFVDVIGDGGRKIDGIFKSRFEEIDRETTPVDPIGIWAHHKC